MARETRPSGLLASPSVLAGTAYYVEPAGFVLAAVGAVDSAGLTYQLQVPNDPALRGDLICFQGITLPSAGGFAASNAALWHVE